MSNSKKIVWYNLAFMAFSTVWGFGNVVNGFVYFNGVQVIFSWIMMFALYFVPYALMVGELGSAFKNAGGGVSSWIQETLGPKLAYYAGWTYWVVHMPYIASKASGGLKALSWVLFQNSSFYDSLDIRLVQIITLVVFLVFAVGGCEKISPYVNKVENPSKGFPKGMIALAIMVIICAILGTISMGMMFNVAEINANFDSYVANGAYWSFQKLGEYYGIGNTFLIVYAVCNMVGQLSTLVISIDAPLRMLLDNENARQFIPAKLLKKNDKGAYTNGILLVVAIVTPLILIPALGIGSVTAFLKFLTQLNSVCMPLRYLWVFIAYIALRKAIDKFPAEYRFTKSQFFAKFFGWWCFIVTAACCALGMFKGSAFEIAMNIITPIILVGLGAIMPALAKRGKTSQ